MAENYLTSFSGIPVLWKENVFSLTPEEYEHIMNQETIPTPAGNSVSTSGYVLENDKMVRVKEMMQSQFDDYIVNVLRISNKFSITNSWTTRNKNSEPHGAHSHANSMFSAVYYVKATSGEIRLYLKPTYSQSFNFKFDIIEYNDINSGHWSYPVKTGDVLIFPSHIVHEVLPNEDVEDRIILGANCFLSDTVGNEKDFDEVTI